MRTTAIINRSIVTAAFLLSVPFAAQAALQVHYPDGSKCQPEIKVQAPGQYGVQHEDLDSAGSDSYTITINADVSIYVVAHAVVSGI